MQALRAKLLAGEPVSHFGNFSAASFMLRIGMTVDEVVEMYSQRGDFDPRIARYQVEHIAGLKGSRTKYSVPRCGTMQTHGLCIENGRLCGGVRSPMEYYRRMARRGGVVEGGRLGGDEKAPQEGG
jgi:DNA primase large subunit